MSEGESEGKKERDRWPGVVLWSKAVEKGPSDPNGKRMVPERREPGAPWKKESVGFAEGSPVLPLSF